MRRYSARKLEALRAIEWAVQEKKAEIREIEADIEKLDEAWRVVQEIDG